MHFASKDSYGLIGVGTGRHGGLSFVVSQRLRFCMLSELCQQMCNHASHLEEGTQFLIDLINHEIEHMKTLSKSKTTVHISCASSNRASAFKVQDPIMTRTKGCGVDKTNKEKKKKKNKM